MMDIKRKKDERIQFYQEWLEQEKKRIEINYNIRKWEIENRYIS